jgi:hypothetical protein
MPLLPPAHHEISKRDSPNETKIKKTKWNSPGFEFKPCQVNDSSQSNQGIDRLVSQENKEAYFREDAVLAKKKAIRSLTVQKKEQ